MIKEKRPYYFWVEGVGEGWILTMSGIFAFGALLGLAVKVFPLFLSLIIISVAIPGYWAICGNLMERYKLRLENKAKQLQTTEITKDLKQRSEPEKAKTEIINNRTAMTDEQLDLVEKNRDAIKSLIGNLERLREKERLDIQVGRSSDSCWSLDMIDGRSYNSGSIQEKLRTRLKHAISREIVLVIIELVNDVKEIYPEWQITDPELKRLIDENRAQIPKDKEHLDGILGVLERYSQG